MTFLTGTTTLYQTIVNYIPPGTKNLASASQENGFRRTVQDSTLSLFYFYSLLVILQSVIVLRLRQDYVLYLCGPLPPYRLSFRNNKSVVVPED
jgi:hypothetical protein